MGTTKIEWAETVWNPITGCTPVSAGCQNCYARRMANRLRGRCGYDKDEPFRVTIHMDRMNDPLRWRKPRMIFVCSMGDLFHQEIPDQTIADVFRVMMETRNHHEFGGPRAHRFLILTKRPARMRAVWARLRFDNAGKGRMYVADSDNAPGFCPMTSQWMPYVWAGVSVENQDTANYRIPILMQIPAAVRFVSCEPLLGPINLGDADCEWWQSDGIDWVIAGGESGPGARPMHPDWARSLRDQCQAVGVPFFLKQLGEYAEWEPEYGVHNVVHLSCDGQRSCEPCYVRSDSGELAEAITTPLVRVGKKAAGRELDGRTWDQMPKVGE